MVFGVFDFLQKRNERIRLYYYDNSSRLVLVCFLEEIEDTKKTFRNYCPNVYTVNPNHSISHSILDDTQPVGCV